MFDTANVEPTDYAAQLVRFTDGDRNAADALFCNKIKNRRDGDKTLSNVGWNEAVRDAIGCRGDR